MTYLNRLKNDLGIEGEIVKMGDSFYVVYRKGLTDFKHITPLSELLIKNIDKIAQLDFVNELITTLMVRLFEAIKNGTEEEFAKSLYNNK